jgi:hypothetical protein
MTGGETKLQLSNKFPPGDWVSAVTRTDEDSLAHARKSGVPANRDAATNITES